jgi:UDP-N-acetylmuramoyl-L-alanyl-D-glutamate--2,6-diaminopimelate ligase
MDLKEVLKDVNIISKHCVGNIDIKGITADSRLVREGYCFIAVKGPNTDGHIFIKDALQRGAVVIIGELRSYAQEGSGYKINNGIPYVEVKNSHDALVSISKTFYSNPSESVRVIGVTGTNGKTTTVYLLESILKAQGFCPGVIGTINYKIKDRIIPAINTTPGPVELQSLLALMRDEGCLYCCMEVSSHSLDQGRVEGINFRCAIFTNLTQDHLDYHKTMENYFRAKAKLFETLPINSSAVLNIDDECFEMLSKMTKAKIITYGFDERADIHPLDISYSTSRTLGKIITPVGTIEIESRLAGRYNTYNIMGCIGAGICEGIKKQNIEQGIRLMGGIPGRLEPVENNLGISIYVDYAHTDEALKSVLQTLKEIKKHNRLIVVFGCGGDRDKTKRPKMGSVASLNADYVVVTSDNPRTENPESICRDIEKGMDSKSNYTIIIDRREAIRFALNNAKQGDIVLIAGKGHEKYQIFKDTVVPFDDKQEAKEIADSR